MLYDAIEKMFLFHKQTLLTSEESEEFHTRFFVAKNGSSDSKTVKKKGFFKEPLTGIFYCILLFLRVDNFYILISALNIEQCSK